jgi:DNA-binding beta-propeller fold protein YncE
MGSVFGNSYRDYAFVKPMGICLDESGNLCVTDTGTKAVWFFDLGRKRYRRWEKIERYPFISPVAVVKKNKVLYVADSGQGCVIVFDRSGDLLFRITEGLERPTGLALGARDTLWVTDSARHRVEVYDLEGRHLFGFGKRGTGLGEFNYPTHLVHSHKSNDAVYITDAMNFRVQKVNQEGAALLSFGAVGQASGSFSRPKGVAVDQDENLYVVDALFDNIQIFDSAGRFLMHWGGNGSEPGFFWLPTGIAIDAEDRIWVADSYNRRIQVFKRVDQDEEAN